MGASQGILYVVGIGPGAQDHATPAALAAIADAELIFGYTTYIRLVGHLIGTLADIRAKVKVAGIGVRL
jgi:precorrin-3B C17-methyltransferase / cobalt-factor III methyltransferase